MDRGRPPEIFKHGISFHRGCDIVEREAKELGMGGVMAVGAGLV